MTPVPFPRIPRKSDGECCCLGGCTYCSGTPPDEMEVVVAGIVTALDCGDCALLNGTYTLALTRNEEGDCVWHYDFPVTRCGVVAAEAQFIENPIATGWALLVTLIADTISGSGRIGWLETYETEPECVSPDELVVAYYLTDGAMIGVCDATSSTATVTAL